MNLKSLICGKHTTKNSIENRKQFIDSKQKKKNWLRTISTMNERVVVYDMFLLLCEVLYIILYACFDSWILNIYLKGILRRY